MMGIKDTLILHRIDHSKPYINILQALINNIGILEVNVIIDGIITNSLNVVCENVIKV